MTDSPLRLSLSDMAVQMENLIHTLIPFKRNEITKWKEAQVNEVERLRQWYDDHILSLEDELRILNDHAAALGMETNSVPLHEREPDEKPNEKPNPLADSKEENLNGPHI